MSYAGVVDTRLLGKPKAFDSMMDIAQQLVDGVRKARCMYACVRVCVGVCACMYMDMSACVCVCVCVSM